MILSLIILYGIIAPFLFKSAISLVYWWSLRMKFKPSLSPNWQWIISCYTSRNLMNIQYTSSFLFIFRLFWMILPLIHSFVLLLTSCSPFFPIVFPRLLLIIWLLWPSPCPLLFWLLICFFAYQNYSILQSSLWRSVKRKIPGILPSFLIIRSVTISMLRFNSYLRRCLIWWLLYY